MPKATAPLDRKTKSELLALAKRRGVTGVSSKTKAEIIAALNDAAPPSSKRSSSKQSSPKRPPPEEPPPLRAGLTADSSTDDDRVTLQAAGPGWWRVEWSVSAATLQRAEKAVGVSQPVVRLFSGGGADAVQEEPVAGPGRLWFVRCDVAGALRASLVLVPVGGGRHFTIAKSKPAAASSAPVGALPPLPDEVRGEIDRLHDGEEFEFAIAAGLRLHGRATPGTRVTAGEAKATSDDFGRFEVTVPIETGRALLPLEVRTAAGSLRHTGVASADFNLRVMTPSEDE